MYNRYNNLFKVNLKIIIFKFKRKEYFIENRNPIQIKYSFFSLAFKCIITWYSKAQPPPPLIRQPQGLTPSPKIREKAKN